MPAESVEELRFEPDLKSFLSTRRDQHVTVLAGANNTGKSVTLKLVRAAEDKGAYMVGTNRFYHVYHFQTRLRAENELQKWDQQFRQQFRRADHNYEQNYIDLNRIITNFNDKKRRKLFDICGQLLDAKFDLKRVNEGNELSPRYVDMDGQNVSVGSTGTRLLMTLIGILMDDRFHTILIDEPELGLAPTVQVVIAALLNDKDKKAELFPHLERVFVATHSHLFLDRNSVSNNFVISKSEDVITLEQIQTISELHQLQFNLLGNSLEALYLPAAIIIVEGKTDHRYIERLLGLKFPGRRIAVVPSQGDVKRKVHGLRETLHNLQTSPFRNRLFVVLDRVHQPDLEVQLVNMGVVRENIVKWARNGIEYVYPPDIISKLYGTPVDKLDRLQLEGDLVRLGDVSFKKGELVKRVVRSLSADVSLPSELEEKLLKPLRTAIGGRLAD